MKYKVTIEFNSEVTRWTDNAIEYKVKEVLNDSEVDGMMCYTDFNVNVEHSDDT